MRWKAKAYLKVFMICRKPQDHVVNVVPEFVLRTYADIAESNHLNNYYCL